MPPAYRLETERLILRRLELEDAARMRLLANDVAIAAFLLTMPHPYPEGAAVEFIRHVQEAMDAGRGYTFAIVPRDALVLVGLIGIHPTPEHRRAELGYWIGRAYWGRGYASEAARRLVRFGFEELELNRIYAACFVHNIASARVMQKAGMKYEGTLRQHFVRFERVHDTAYYGILRDEWDAG